MRYDKGGSRGTALNFHLELLSKYFVFHIVIPHYEIEITIAGDADLHSGSTGFWERLPVSIDNLRRNVFSFGHSDRVNA